LLSLFAFAVACGDWALVFDSAWFHILQRPDNDKNPQRDHKSRFCCGVADTVKTRFKVEPGTEKYPGIAGTPGSRTNGFRFLRKRSSRATHPTGKPIFFMLARYGAMLCASEGRNLEPTTAFAKFRGKTGHSRQCRSDAAPRADEVISSGLLRCQMTRLHFSAVPTAPSNVGYREQTGRHMLNASSSHFDPTAVMSRVGIPHCNEPLT
jgi:hypothetical protein